MNNDFVQDDLGFADLLTGHDERHQVLYHYDENGDIVGVCQDCGHEDIVIPSDHSYIDMNGELMEYEPPETLYEAGRKEI